MKAAAWAAVWVVVAGVAGIYLGALLNLEGYLGVVLAIAAAAYHIVAALDSGNGGKGGGTDPS